MEWALIWAVLGPDNHTGPQYLDPPSSTQLMEWSWWLKKRPSFDTLKWGIKSVPFMIGHQIICVLGITI